jgi:ADP-heptose:LPS heptosyltransferase
LGLIGIQPKLGAHAYELYFRKDEQEKAASLASELGLAGKKWLGIHVGSGGTKNLALRRWPVGHYAELLQRLKARLPGVPVVLFGGPGEREAHEALRGVVGNGFIEPQTRNLRSAAALLSHAWGFLSVDTVFMHLAAAVRVPHQMVIETPTLNPPVCPLRDTWTMIPNPEVKGRHLDFYRYDGRSIAGTPEELQRMMASVSVDSVVEACCRAFAG